MTSSHSNQFVISQWSYGPFTPVLSYSTPTIRISVPDSKQEIKHPLERPFFGKTRADVTYDEFLFFRHCKEYRYEPKT